MSTIQELTQSSTSTSAASTATVKSDDVMGKQDFLKLLVTQLQNQDPLNPDDPTEFTAQLAQFSSLEQLYNLNDSMTSLTAANAQSDKISSLQTIGKDVAYAESSFDYTSGEVEVGYQLDGTATEVKVLLKKNGVTIDTLSGTTLTKGNHYLTWDGLTSSGLAAESGSYKIVIQAKAAEGESIAASPLIKSEVTGVDLSADSGGTLLTKAGEVSFTSVLGVYEAKQTTTTSTASADNTSLSVSDSGTSFDVTL